MKPASICVYSRHKVVHVFSRKFGSLLWKTRLKLKPSKLNISIRNTYVTNSQLNLCQYCNVSTMLSWFNVLVYFA